MFLLAFYVPFDAAEKVKNVLFAAGAGRLGAYEACSFETIGKGQFRPLPGSHPAVGEINQIQVTDEIKVEMICVDEKIKTVVEALKQHHPYETPAYQVIKIEDF